jgi:hypothetical protein
MFVKTMMGVCAIIAVIIDVANAELDSIAPTSPHWPGTSVALCGRPHAFLRGPVENGGEN